MSIVKGLFILRRHLISTCLCCALAKDALPLLGTWIQVPNTVGSIQRQDIANVVFQDTIDVETTSDQAAGLEQIVVVLGVRALRCVFT